MKHKTKTDQQARYELWDRQSQMHGERESELNEAFWKFKPQNKSKLHYVSIHALIALCCLRSIAAMCGRFLSISI